MDINGLEAAFSIEFLKSHLVELCHPHLQTSGYQIPVLSFVKLGVIKYPRYTLASEPLNSFGGLMKEWHAYLATSQRLEPLF